MNEEERLPYPGMRAFRRDESDLFFGREGHVDTMVDRLSKTRFLAVLGPSGSGKSSLVRTGLLDALDLGYAPAGSAWCVADMRPGSQPIRNLAEALLSFSATPVQLVDIDMLTALLQRGPRALAEWAGSGNLPEGYNLLILVDQFEELFRYADYAGREDAEAFVKLLLEAAQVRELPLFVCITMRSEYLGACAMIPGLAEAINNGLYLTPRLTREQCREAIVGPAGVCRFEVEPALVNKILNDMAAIAAWEYGGGDNPLQRLSQRADQLPLMQHVLNRMWLTASAAHGDEGAVLRKQDYDEMGGLKGALDSHGDEILAQLGDARYGTAERVFRALTSGVSLDNAVRRPSRFGDLAAELQGDREGVLAVIEAFRAPTANFLQPPRPVPIDDETVIDISHESLIRQWTTLSRWFAAEAQSASTWKDLLSATQRNRDNRANLLSGLDLAQASAWWEQEQPTAEWAARHGGDYEAVRDFVRKSEAKRSREAAATEQRLLRERKRLRIQLAASVAVLVVVAGLGVTSTIFWRDARASANAALVSEEKAQGSEQEARRLQAIAQARAQQLARKQEDLLQARRTALIDRDEARRQRDRADRQAAEARASAERAAISERAAQRSQQTLERQIEDIGEIIVGSDSSYSVDSSDTRVQIAKFIPGHRLLRPASAPGLPATDPDRESSCVRPAHQPADLARPRAVHQRTGNVEASGPALAATDLRREISCVLAVSLGSLTEMAGVEPEHQLADFARLRVVHERAGNVEASVQALVDGWQLAERMLRSPGWDAFSPDTRRLVFRIGHIMAWRGEALGMPDSGRNALRSLREIARSYGADSAEVLRNPELATIFANYENLETTMVADRTYPIEAELAATHADNAVRYASVAYDLVTAQEDPTVSHATAAHMLGILVSNRARFQRGETVRQLVEESCLLAEKFHTRDPLDERAIRQMALCATNRTALEPSRQEYHLHIWELADAALNDDPNNQFIRSLRVAAATGLINAMTDGSRCGDEQCEALLAASVADLRELLSVGYVPDSGFEATQLLDVLDRFQSADERFRLSQEVVDALEPRMAETYFRQLFGAAFRRALIAAGMAMRADGNATPETEARFRRAANLHRENPPPISLSQRDAISDLCWLESLVMRSQRDLRMTEQALETARVIARSCEDFLVEAPWDMNVRGHVLSAYNHLLELDPPDSDDSVARARRFTAEFRANDRYDFLYVDDSPGTLAPSIGSVQFHGWASARSEFDDFLRHMASFGTRVGPASAVEFLSMASEMARERGVSATCLARNGWNSVSAEQDLGAISTEEELDPLYRRAQLALANDGDSLALACSDTVLPAG